MYKACIFDLDGTLTDTLESLTYSVNQTLMELGLRQITREQCRMFVGDGAKRLMERALKAAGDEELTRIDEAMDAYGRIFGENCTYHVKPYEGIVKLLQTLKEEGILAAVLSNKPHAQTIAVVERFFAKGTFTWIQGQCDSIKRKPDPAGVFYVAEKLSVSLDECLYIGDSDVDMETAKAAGAESVGVTWGFRSREVLKNAGAEHLVERPEEIIELIRNKGRM